jgi:hypothetical protein
LCILHAQVIKYSANWDNTNLFRLFVRGCLDDDNGGSAPWRIQEWAAEQPFRNVFMLSGVGHSLEPWLSAASWKNDGSDNIPTFHQIVTELVST